MRLGGGMNRFALDTKQAKAEHGIFVADHKQPGVVHRVRIMNEMIRP